MGLFASATLLLLRHVEPLTFGRGLLAGAGLLIALLAVGFGRRRGRRARTLRPGPGHSTVREPRAEVVAFGWTVAAFAAGAVALRIG